MAIENHRERVSARVRQAITQSGVDLSALAPGQEERLVNTVTDGVLLELDALLSEAAPAMPDALSADPAHAEEQTLWAGRPFLSIGEYYVITDDRIRLFTGLFSRRVENVELVRLQDVDYHQGVSERIFGIGDIYLHSADASDPTITLKNVKDPEAVADIIRKVWLAARKKYGVRFREEM
jgi:hypothetical protein